MGGNMLKKLLFGCGAILFIFNLAAGNGVAEESQNKDIIIATTTSTVDTGLLDVLLPVFEKQTGYRVKTISAGTGQALAMAEKGETDVLLTHAPDAEKKYVDEGIVTNYRLLMHNDFVIAGPAEDPAGIRGKSSADAFAAIAAKQALFISRGDDSGTNKKELSIWKKTGITPAGAKWYQETGQGMGATLLMASEKNAYTLTDRATYLSQKANIKLQILIQGDASLRNIYHIMQVNPRKFGRANAQGAGAFIDFMVDPKTQEMIGRFGMDKFGEPLFFPDAGKNM